MQRDKKLVHSPAFSGKGALSAAKLWRADRLSAQGRGKNIVPSRRTLREAAEEWLAGAKAEPPTLLNRSGHPYKPSVLRSYEHDLRAYVLDDLGGLRLSEVRRADLQALVDRLVGKGLSGSKVRNIVIPLRVVFRHALERDEINANPTSGLRLPNNVGRRERAASPSEAADLLAALPDTIRPIYATAFYAGLRRGEMRALRWERSICRACLCSIHRVGSNSFASQAKLTGKPLTSRALIAPAAERLPIRRSQLVATRWPTASPHPAP